MSIVMFEGFDHLADEDMAEYGWTWETSYNYAHISSSYARFSTAESGADLSGGLHRETANGDHSSYTFPGSTTYSTIVFGFAFCLKADTPATNANNGFLRLIEGSTIQAALCLNANHGLDAYSNGSLQGSSSNNTILLNNWYYIEVKVVFSTSVGSMQVKIDNTTVINETGINTAPSTNEYFNKFALADTYNDKTVQFDDLYIDDSSFLGPLRIKTFQPDDDHANNDFTPSNGTECWEDIDDATLDADAYYAYSDTDTEQLVVEYTTGAFGGTILGVQHDIGALCSEVNPLYMYPLCVSNGSDYKDSQKTLNTTTQGYRYILETDPDDSNTWTQAKIEAGGFGTEAIWQ